MVSMGYITLYCRTVFSESVFSGVRLTPSRRGGLEDTDHLCPPLQLLGGMHNVSCRPFFGRSSETVVHVMMHTLCSSLPVAVPAWNSGPFFLRCDHVVLREFIPYA